MTDPAPKPLLATLRGERQAVPPLWLMRQAGRSLPEYLKIREGTAMLDSCFRTDM